MPNTNSDGRGAVKDPKTDGRLKENQTGSSGGSSGSGSRSGGSGSGGSGSKSGGSGRR